MCPTCLRSFSSGHLFYYNRKMQPYVKRRFSLSSTTDHVHIGASFPKQKRKKKLHYPLLAEQLCSKLLGNICCRKRSEMKKIGITWSYMTQRLLVLFFFQVFRGLNCTSESLRGNSGAVSDVTISRCLKEASLHDLLTVKVSKSPLTWEMAKVSFRLSFFCLCSPLL